MVNTSDYLVVVGGILIVCLLLVAGCVDQSQMMRASTICDLVGAESYKQFGNVFAPDYRCIMETMTLDEVRLLLQELDR